MPTYDFLNQENGEIIEKQFSNWEEKDAWLKENTNYVQTYTKAPGVISGSGGRAPSGFNEVLAKVAEKHPNSAVADRVGGRGIKEAKTREVVKKHVERVTKRIESGKG
jgi:hypothetical protein